MDNLLTDIIDLISNNSIFIASKKIFNKYKKELNVGYAYVKSEGFDPVLFSSLYDDNERYEYKNDLASIVFFKDSSSTKWSDENIALLNSVGKLIYSEIEKELLRNNLKNATDKSLKTNVPNVNYFLSQINRINQDELLKYNVYYLDIKSTDLINQTYGRKAGDKVICGFADGLSAFLNEGEYVGHLGADQFIAFVNRTRNEEFIKYVSMFNIELEPELCLQISAVIGIFEVSPTYSSEDYITNSKIAFKYAKDNKKPYAYFSNEICNSLFNAKKVEGSFKNDLNDGSFVTYYQPKVDIASGRIIGCEALARYVKDGIIHNPSYFVPILEMAGSIIDLDLYMIENACKDITEYYKSGKEIVPISCNISRKDLDDPDIEEKLLGIINKYELATKYLVIEITETSSIKEKDRLQKFISTLHKNGVKVSIDDFGTGYSSLSTLRDFKVNEIKIDRSFIDKKIYESDRVILKSIIEMAKKLNIHVICEGVETKTQAKLLLSLGCGNAQGYLYDMPLSKLEFEDKLSKQYYVI